MGEDGGAGVKSYPYFLPLLASLGITPPAPEYWFAKPRRWRFDYAWPEHKLALEVQGGIWTKGRHTRGAAMLKEWEKLNTAAEMGWRILYCQPKELLKEQMALTIVHALDWRPLEDLQSR